MTDYGNVYDYFVNRLDKRPPIEEHLVEGWRDIPVDSGCGDDCKAAVDAAKAYLDINRKAGLDAHTEECVLATISDTINTFIFG